MPFRFGRKACLFESMKSSTTSKKPSMAHNEGKGGSIEWSFVGADQLISMMKVHKKIFVFRDIMDLAPINTSASLLEMVITTLEDLQRLYPGIIPSKKVSNIKNKPINEGLAYFCEALESLGESWMINNDSMEKHSYELPACKDNTNMKQLGETMSTTLDCLIKIASEKFDIMEEDDPKKVLPYNSFSDMNYSPVTPKSVLPESMTPAYSSTIPLWSPRAVEKLNPIDLKRLSYHMSSPRMQTHKIKKEPTMNMEIIDPKVENPENKISQDIVLPSGTTSDHGETYDNPQAKEDVEKLSVSPKPLQTPTLQQKAQGSVASPSSPLTPPPPPPPPPSPLPTTCTIPPPPPTSSPPVLQPNRALPPPPPLPLSSSLALVPPPPPPIPFKSGPAPAPPPSMPRGSGAAAPPPPPPGAGRCLRPKATTKLKRSTQLGNLYRTLKGKVEGSNIKGKSSGGRTNAIGAGTSGKLGMADALAEMTKRSSYFQQIEEDVQRYTKQIIELRSAITNFKTKDMIELVKFHKDVESVLENLTDESQVLSRFEGFPSKKLEAIRMATALYLRLDSILTELQNWNIVTPVGQFLDKAERYFNKIKTELDSMERTKDEESKKFKSHNIEFDFNILIKIKEAIVDVSSNCMELAIKERRSDAATRVSGSNISDGKRKEHGKLLWRTFQFAFRVYTFAGGHDDRADKLTRELAKEIESDPNQP
ncbi:hypothetical protein PHAVU_006G188600 [Phaseolus vulgaris]|nr:hypothetical protein PHAVU_006G188600g [Phaseolus vulgaris]ESW20196.1 hypothetical protein PHAVU_006G188600g [Phaseolus vulgaris]